MGSNFINRGEAIEVNFGAASTDLTPATWETGDPIMVGDLPAVAMTPRTAASEKATIWTYGKYRLRVNAPSGGANAGTVGKSIFMIGTAANGTFLTTNASATGAKFWGYLLGTLAAGANGIVDVKCGRGG